VVVVVVAAAAAARLIQIKGQALRRLRDATGAAGGPNEIMASCNPRVAQTRIWKTSTVDGGLRPRRPAERICPCGMTGT
jgi:hypothetical protein